MQFNNEIEHLMQAKRPVHLTHTLVIQLGILLHCLKVYVKQAYGAHNAFSILSGLHCSPKLVLPQGDASFHLTTEYCPFLHSDEEDSCLFQLNGSSSDESGPSTVERFWLQSPAVELSPLSCGPSVPLNFGKLADSDSDIMDVTCLHFMNSDY